MVVLIPEFRRVLKKAWSVRLAMLSAAFSGAEALSYVIPYLGGVFPDRTLAMLGALAAVGAVGARIVAQPKMMGGK